MEPRLRDPTNPEPINNTGTATNVISETPNNIVCNKPHNATNVICDKHHKVTKVIFDKRNKATNVICYKLNMAP